MRLHIFTLIGPRTLKFEPLFFLTPGSPFFGANLFIKYDLQSSAVARSAHGGQ